MIERMLREGEGGYDDGCEEGELVVESCRDGGEWKGWSSGLNFCKVFSFSR